MSPAAAVDVGLTVIVWSQIGADPVQPEQVMVSLIVQETLVPASTITESPLSGPTIEQSPEVMDQS